MGLIWIRRITSAPLYCGILLLGMAMMWLPSLPLAAQTPPACPTVSDVSDCNHAHAAMAPQCCRGEPTAAALPAIAGVQLAEIAPSAPPLAMADACRPGILQPLLRPPERWF